MSGGGGGGSGMMMAMMMQQQQAQQATQAEQSRLQSIESGRQFDITSQYNQQQAAQQAAQFAAQQAAQSQQYEESQQSSRDYAASQASAQDKAAQSAMQQLQAQQDFQMQMYQRQQDAQAAQDAAVKADQQTKLNTWNNQRTGLYNSSLSDALNQLSGMGDTDPNDTAAVRQQFANTNGSIGDLQNLSGVFDGLAQKTFANLTAQKQSAFSKTYNQLFPEDFATTKVADTTDDDILNAIMGDQYTEASQNAARLRDRGVITSEGYDANIKALDKQKPGSLSKLTIIGDNQIGSERTSLTGIANTGRQAIANYQLGQQFDPLSYQNKVNSAYDTWFSGLDTKLRGLAPTDLFDTSGFLNTAGSVQGPMNSPFVGATNALTGADASSASTDDDTKKKNSSNALGSPVTGVF